MRPLDFVERAIESYSDRIAIIDGGAGCSYRQIDELSNSLAARLLADGLEDRDLVAVYSPADWRLIPCMLAIMRAGGVMVPVGGAASVDGVVALLNRLKPQRLLFHSTLVGSVQQVCTRVSTLSSTMCFDQYVSDGTGLAPLGDDAVVRNGDDWADICGISDRPIVIAQTGGTTGTAKAVVIRTVAYTTYIESYRRLFDGDERHPVCLTASQVTPSIIGIGLVMLTLGAAHVVLPTFQATAVLEAIERHRVTHLWMPPAALFALVSHPSVSRFNLSSVRALVVGGSAIAPNCLRRAVEVFGPHVFHTYGQIETGVLAWLCPTDISEALKGHRLERLASCGRINESMRVAIMDETGRLLPRGAVGEIVVRGRGVSEYYDDPELTASGRAHRWHHTGDAGSLDEDGFLRITGRLKDVIITGGLNVYPSEVEAVLFEILGVRDCAVIGIDDEFLGEIVTAVIVSEPTRSPTRERVLGHCRARLGRVMAPKRVEFVGAIPRTAAGKVDRMATRAIIAQHLSTT